MKLEYTFYYNKALTGSKVQIGLLRRFLSGFFICLGYFIL